MRALEVHHVGSRGVLTANRGGAGGERPEPGGVLPAASPELSDPDLLGQTPELLARVWLSGARAPVGVWLSKLATPIGTQSSGPTAAAGV